MNTKRLMVCSLILMLTGGLALADGGHGFRGAPHHVAGGMNPERLVHRLERVLELDTSQRQALENVARAATPEFEALGERANENAKAMRALDVTDEGYAVALENLAREAGEVATEAVLLHGRLRADISAELTEAQREALSKFLESRRERARERRGTRRRDGR